MAPLKAMVLDMTNVKEGGPSFNKRRVPEGDYLAKITKVEDAPVKSGDNKGAAQWLFTITLVEKANAVYPYYCQFAENQLWKIRNLLVAAGITVPRKRVKVDPEKLVNKTIAVTLQDGEYEGKEQSEIAAIFSPSEMDGGSSDVDEEEEDEEEDEEPTPAPKTKRRAPEPEPEEDEDDDEEAEDEEEKEPEPEPAPRKKRRAPAPPPDDDDDDEDEEEPAPRKRAAKKVAPATRRTKRQVTDEELEELDIDDI